MVWYESAVEAVDIVDRDVSETDRMWRRIDPVVAASKRRALDEESKNNSPATGERRST